MSDPTVQDVSRAYELYVTITVCTFAVVATTVLRIGTKLVYRLSLRWDDYFMILGTCLNVVANGFNYKTTASGFGRHARFLASDELIEAEKYAQLSVIVAGIAIWATKISICFFLLAIIKGTHVRFVWLIRFVMGFTTASQFVAALLWGLQAKPLPKLWDPRVHGTRKSPESFLAVVYVYYVFVMVTDIFYALSPIYFLWNIQMSMKRKAQILALTGSGFLLIIVVALDIAFAREFLNVDDVTWALVKLFICDNIERNISGFIANLPAIWFLFRNLEKKSSSPTSSPLKNLNHTRIVSEDIQKPTALPTAIHGKVRQPDPDSSAADDCIPLRQLSGKGSSFHAVSAGSLGSEWGGDEKTVNQESTGGPRGWEDPTLEEGYNKESAEARSGRISGLRA